MAGWEGDSLWILKVMFVASVHCCCQLNPVLPDRDRFPAASNIWSFLKLMGIFNQTLDIFILISTITPESFALGSIFISNLQPFVIGHRSFLSWRLYHPSSTPILWLEGHTCRWSNGLLEPSWEDCHGKSTNHIPYLPCKDRFSLPWQVSSDFMSFLQHFLCSVCNGYTAMIRSPEPH